MFSKGDVNSAMDGDKNKLMIICSLKLVINKTLSCSSCHKWKLKNNSSCQTKKEEHRHHFKSEYCEQHE